jgi:exportin-T
MQQPGEELTFDAERSEKGATGLAALVQVPAEELRKAKTTIDYKINFADYPASVLGELMMRTIQSNVAAWPHPAVPLQFFEVVSRYHDFFNLAPQTIMTVLPVFLDER